MSQVASSNEWSRQVAAARKQCGEDIGKHLTRIEKLNQSRLAHAYCAGKALAERKSHMGKRWLDGVDCTRQWANRLIQFSFLADNHIGDTESALSNCGVDAAIRVLRKAAEPPPPERTQGDIIDQGATQRAQVTMMSATNEVRPVSTPLPDPPATPRTKKKPPIRVEHLQPSGTTKAPAPAPGIPKGGDLAKHLVALLGKESEAFRERVHYMVADLFSMQQGADIAEAIADAFALPNDEQMNFLEVFTE